MKEWPSFMELCWGMLGTGVVLTVIAGIGLRIGAPVWSGTRSVIMRILGAGVGLMVMGVILLLSIHQK